MPVPMEKCPGSGSSPLQRAYTNPRASCPVCGKSSALTRARTIRAHTRVIPRLEPIRISPTPLKNPRSTCGECDKSALPDDYLCEQHRNEADGVQKEYEVPLVITVRATSLEGALDEASDLADSIGDTFEISCSAIVGEDHNILDKLGIIRGRA